METVKIGEYEIFDKLGSGSMGDVYKGRKINSDELVAVKIMAKELSENPKNIARFKREIRHTIMLDHPNIVATYTAGEIKGRPYCVMEYVEGKTLGQMINHSGMLDEKCSVEIIIDIAQALNYAHSLNGLIHRDIKPENIMVTDGVAKLMDMGIAKTKDTSIQITQMGMVIGSPGYMSPEQAQGQELDTRSDIYSLGATFYHMLTGRIAFKGSTPVEVMMSTVQHDPDPITDIVPGISIQTCQVIEKMLQKAPDQRYQSFAELLEDLSPLKNSLQGQVSATPTPSSDGKKYPQCYVPSYSDTLLGQISIRNKLITPNDAEKGLDRQEKFALMGMELDLATVLYHMDILSSKKKIALEKAVGDYILNRGDEIFLKVAKEFGVFVPQWQELYDLFNEQQKKGLAVALWEQGLMNETIRRKLSPYLKHHTTKEITRELLVLTIETKIITQNQAKKCNQIYNEAINRGVYIRIEKILSDQGVDRNRIDMVKRAIRRRLITGKSAMDYFNQQ